MDSIETDLIFSSNKDDNQNKNIQIKITRLDENFLSDLKRKRKLSTDSLDSLCDELDKFEKTNSLQNVEQYLNETGLNVQLIDKNDKKLVKLNINNNVFNKNQNQLSSGISVIKSIINVENMSINKQTAPLTTNLNLNMNKSNTLNDIDDLPSESDVSSGVVLMSIKNPIQQPIKPNLDTLVQQNSITIYFKCTKCSKIFNDESMFKYHHEMQECIISESENEFEKFLLGNDNMDQIVQKEDEKISSNSTKASRKKILICNECGIQFNLQSDLNKHMLQVHENVKPYQCSQCSMSFFELSSKNRHEKEHSGLKPFRCYICSFEFTRASNLRTHLLKVHPNDVGKLVQISKSADNKLKFEFDIEAINIQREHVKNLKLNQIGSSTSKSNLDSPNQTPVNNTVIYIRDPNNKNADIQHMVVYVDGKPIFVQNPKVAQTIDSDNSRDAQVPKTSNKQKQTKSKNSTSNLNKPVAKIPYLLAAAAAAAASNHRKQQQLNQQMVQSQPKIQLQENIRIYQSNNDCIRTVGCSNTNKIKDLKHDQEYLQLVSMFKQKNEKLYNPLKSF